MKITWAMCVIGNGSSQRFPALSIPWTWRRDAIHITCANIRPGGWFQQTFGLSANLVVTISCQWYLVDWVSSRGHPCFSCFWPWTLLPLPPPFHNPTLGPWSRFPIKRCGYNLLAWALTTGTTAELYERYYGHRTCLSCSKVSSN